MSGVGTPSVIRLELLLHEAEIFQDEVQPATQPQNQPYAQAHQKTICLSIQGCEAFLSTCNATTPHFPSPCTSRHRLNTFLGEYLKSLVYSFNSHPLSIHHISNIFIQPTARYHHPSHCKISPSIPLQDIITHHIARYYHPSWCTDLHHPSHHKHVATSSPW